MMHGNIHAATAGGATTIAASEIAPTAITASSMIVFPTIYFSYHTILRYHARRCGLSLFHVEEVVAVGSIRLLDHSTILPFFRVTMESEYPRYY